MDGRTTLLFRVASALLVFLFTWHSRADFVESWRAAVAANEALAQECR